MLEQPVFIGGMYKSGTTLLRMMLSQHSDMVSGLETFWFDLNWEDRNSGRTEYVGRRWDGTRDEAPGDQIERLCRYYGLDPVAHADRIDACSSREEFLDFLLTTYAATCGAGRWTEKTPPPTSCTGSGCSGPGPTPASSTWSAIPWTFSPP